MLIKRTIFYQRIVLYGTENCVVFIFFIACDDVHVYWCLRAVRFVLFFWMISFPEILWYFLVFSLSFFPSAVIQIHDIGKIICEAFCFLRAARMLCIDSKIDPIEFTIKYIFYSSYDNKIMSKKCAHKCKIMSNTKKGNTKHTRSNDINAKNRWHTEHTTIKLKLIITIITKIYFPVYHTESFHILLIIICRRLNREEKKCISLCICMEVERWPCVSSYICDEVSNMFAPEYFFLLHQEKRFKKYSTQAQITESRIFVNCCKLWVKYERQANQAHWNNKKKVWKNVPGWCLR